MKRVATGEARGYTDGDRLFPTFLERAMSTAFASVQVRTVSPTLDSKVGATDLCRKVKNCNTSWQVQGGLTDVDLNPSPVFTLLSKGVESKVAGKIRFYFEQTNIDLSFRWVKVWLAKELKSGSCPYKAVRRHEQKHVDSAHEILRKHAKSLSDSLGKLKIPTKSKPLEIEDSKKSFHDADKKYTALVRKVVTDKYSKKVQTIYNEIGTRWGKLETKAEYKRVQKSCKESEWPI